MFYIFPSEDKNCLFWVISVIDSKKAGVISQMSHFFRKYVQLLNCLPDFAQYLEPFAVPYTVES